MRLIDADKAIEDYAYYGKEHMYDAFDLERILNEQPTVCDIEQISSARYNNGFYDGKKAMKEKIEQIRAEIAEEAKCTMNENRAGGLYKALQIIDKYSM